MPVVISMLRGVNLGPHNRIKMQDLRKLCTTLGLCDVQTYVQSGNVLCRTDERNLTKFCKSFEDAFEKKFKFRSDIVCRTAAELKAVVAKNPFANRPGIDPAKLLVTFLSADPGDKARAQLRALKTDPEELWIDGNEVFLYFPSGAGRPKLPWPAIPKMLKVTGTARNWNSVTKMLEMAQAMASKV